MVATPVLISLLLGLTGDPVEPSTPDPELSAATRAGSYAHVAGSVVGGLAGGFGGAGIAYGVARLTCPDWQNEGCGLATLLFAMPVGFVLGTPIGSWAGGALLSGHGDFFPTFVGAIAGGLAGVGVIGAASRWRELSWAPPVALFLPMVGAVIGYQWSHATKLSRLQAIPLVVPEGGGVVLVGVF